jgi:hypothetical protein
MQAESKPYIVQYYLELIIIKKHVSLNRVNL